MIDQDAAHLALRTRARQLVVCTTGVTQLAATATGYSRLVGSFLDDGFYVGMELTPVAFAANPVDTVVAVDALTITIANARAIEASAGGRSLSVLLPAKRAWEDVDFTPTPGSPYVEEEFIPATSGVTSASANGGFVEETGLYVLKWYVPANTGGSGLRRSIDALKALFASGTSFIVGAATLRIRSDIGPFAGQILEAAKGWSYVQLTISWRAESINAIAA